MICKVYFSWPIAHFVIVHLHNRSRADAINRKALWSKSSTAPFLSKYALGILEQRIHQSDNYVVRRLSSTTWGVLHKSYSEGNYQEGEYTKFNRVRKVVIEDEGVPTIINCTCGGIQRFMLPCPHSLAMMEDLKMTVNLCNCHYRWHKLPAYFIHESMQNNDPLKENIESIKIFMDSMYSKSKRCWNGFPINNEQTEAISTIFPEPINDVVYHDMQKILNESLKNGYSLKHARKDSAVIDRSVQQVGDNSAYDSEQGKQSQLSAAERPIGVNIVHLAFSNHEDKSFQQVGETSVYDSEQDKHSQLSAAVWRVVPFINDESDMMEFTDMIESYIQRKTCQKSHHLVDRSVYGSVINTAKVVRRHKYVYEK